MNHEIVQARDCIFKGTLMYTPDLMAQEYDTLILYIGINIEL